MGLEIQIMTLGIASTNAYLIGDTDTNEAVLIDPVDNAALLNQTAEKAGWKIKLILATHSHFDHVLASKELKDLTGAPFYVHEQGHEWLEHLPEQGLRFTGRRFPEAAKPDRLLPDNPERIEVGTIRLEGIYTPGHSQDHLAFFMRDHKILFGGDCLFPGSIGRADLPGGDYQVLMHSIIEKMLPLGDDVQLLPGHMQSTTLGHERQTNPFILDFLRAN